MEEPDRGFEADRVDGVPNAGFEKRVAEVEEGVDWVRRRLRPRSPFPLPRDEPSLAPKDIDDVPAFDPVGDRRSAFPAHQVGDGFCGGPTYDLLLDEPRVARVESREEPQ